MAALTIPRWTQTGGQRVDGYAECTVAIPSDLRDALHLAGTAAGLEPAVLLRTAHVKVLSEISGERAALAGPASWRQLAAAVAAGSIGAANFTDAAAPEVTLGVEEERTILRYRRDVWDPDMADRVSGYHTAALRLLTDDLDAEHGTQSLLSTAELTRQRVELSGPRRPLPTELFVRLFEDRVRLHPDIVAASHNELNWTYAELNTRANQIAHALLHHGLNTEDAVAVVLGRDLNWLAAMLGVYKAGGVYLPVRPDFPPDRVAEQVTRSRCRLALTDPASQAALATAQECAVIQVTDAYHLPDVDDPALAIEPEQLAYIYFTSGSTGAPKGAMCEHAGMLNHLLMKIEDCRLGAGDAVTQTASQCFDISLWQLAAPLLVGGRTVIIDTEVQLDVARFIETVISGGIQVIQVVPSYLDVMLTHFERAGEHPPTLGDLRSISVTGEALKRELVRRWFALYPGITLINAYGATEVSDDTMHAVLDRLPERELAIMPVGVSLRNVNTYIVNENLQIVPLGAPGEIAFSGVCVGRGYINDPERTAQAFVDDPYLPDTRLYRTGDYGRWLPEATIEFLGRRDEQVKIRGFRIEIGEVESRLLRMPGVREAVVVPQGESDNRKLVAFFTGSDALQLADLRDFLAASVPEYMVPSYFHRVPEFPLTENGKVNKKLLTHMAETLGQETAEYVPPATETEQRLATAWAEALGVLVGRIGRCDNFFQLGGTSLAAVRLVVKLDRAVSLRQLVANPVLSELAALIDGAAQSGDGLLQELSELAHAPSASLICFPYAGGNAVNFQQLARELTGRGIRTYGVELPGHDVAGPEEALADVAEIAKRVQEEILAGVPGPVLLWGHCAGAAYALETARLLEAAERPPARVFVGALLNVDNAALEEEIRQVTAADNHEITARLHEESAYVELDLLQSERADIVGRAYRHDVCTTNRFLMDAAFHLATPVEVVMAADDPTTVGYQQTYRAWERLAGDLRLHELDGGGHYFVRSRSAQVAALVDASRAEAAPSW